MLSAEGSVHEWTRQVAETADRLARDALQQLHTATSHPRPTQQPLARSTLPPGLFDPILPNHPLPSQPPERAREAAKLAAVIASLPAPRPPPPTAPSESASLLSAVDAILAEAEAVLKREQHADESEQKESRQAERRQHRLERKEATAAHISETKRQQHRHPALSTQPILPAKHTTTATSTATPSTPHTRPPMAVAALSSRSAEILRMKKAIELRTEQRRRERDEAVKADMLDRQRRDIIARYEEAEGKRREEERKRREEDRKDQEDELLKTQQERQAKEQQEQKLRQDEGKRQQLRQELEDKKRQAAEAIRQQRLLAKQQQQQQLLANYTQTLQRRTDKRTLQQAWQQWLTAVVELRRQKQSKAVSVWRYNCTVRYFGQWRTVVRQVKEERRRVEEESLRRKKEDRRVQAAAHWKLKSEQRSASMSTCPKLRST